MSNIPSLRLNTGALMPAIGLGTFQYSEREAYTSVLHAIKTGYRHIDTATFYGNEGAIGQAIKDSGVPREDIFLTAKIWQSEFSNPHKALDATLKKFRLDYVDLYLIHWPVSYDYRVTWIDAWVKFQDLPKSKTRAIGVSNLDVYNLERLARDPRVTVVPAVNQVEFHPNLAQPRLMKYCKEKRIALQAYAPLGQGKLRNPDIDRLAEKYNVTPANIMLSWGIQRNTAVIPKSANKGRIEENFKYVPLEQEDFDFIENISKTKRRRLVNPYAGENMYHNEADSK